MSASGEGLARRPVRPTWARPPLTLLVTLVVLATSLVIVVLRGTPAEAAACTSSKKGVTVVVDFTKLHHGTKTGCDRKSPASGLDALKGAGFRYTFVPRIPGFVCTINALPKRCNGAPASAYWSYWHAKPHGKWIPGTVQGWAFGAGKPPRISPP
jgi:hypothetical protein